jgi:D-alanyl-D-alanine carboxypeptidase/D-alanyl-D-alanine-endopeptidase (penicillin-binding protein 4)
MMAALWLGAATEGAGRDSKPPAALGRIRQAVTALAAAPTVSTGTVGFYLATLEAPDRPLVQRNPKQSFITASTMKTVTTGTALELLGPHFVFETRVTWHPSTGDVILHGAGDPTLGRGGWDDLFVDWLDGLRALGIGEVRGRVLADESAWERQELPDGWTWLDIGNYYAPPLTPLAFHDNEFRLWYDLAGHPGDPARLVDVEPWPDGLRIVDELVIGDPGTGDEAYAFGAPGTGTYVVRGTLAADAGKEFIRLALPDPALFAAWQFTQFLQSRGVPVHGAPTTTRRLAASGVTVAPTDGVPVATHRSAPLRDMLVPINHRSLNLDCECLLRVLGDGRARDGLAAIRDHFADRRLPLAGFQQADGSGLSRTNMITPELLARANAAFLTGPHGPDFLASLPVLGTPGSTLRRLKTSAPGVVIRAKSGTIERVKGYAGLVETAAGRRYVFSILVNNYDGPYAQDVAPGLAAVFEALARL